jgi:mono/diheme cytochrome c family protein
MHQLPTSSACRSIFLVLFGAALSLLAIPSRSDDTAVPAPSREKGIEFFEKKIRPLLVQHCYECHGPQTQEGELRLDSWAAIRDGGKSGKALLPGNPDRSLMVSAVGYQDVSLQMPPDGRLSDRQIADLRQWIVWGAPHPDDDQAPVQTAPDARPATSDHWAFQIPRRPPLPAVSQTSWPSTPIDYFILARLEEAGLSPAPPADKHALIRRLSHDLTGLPPSPEEVRTFLNDDSAEAYARLVERLLASPRYGERWGRHWLDVARYADSNGSDENIAHGNAWRYRDYVIAAFNDDKPIAEFLTEQLAGDLLPGDDPQQRRERLVATGFLSLGPKVLAEVDETKMEMDIIDEQVDTFGQAMLGLTLGCARCHDHKFDPITAHDYYALAGIFKSTRTMEHFKKIARWWENEVALPDERQRYDEHEAKVAAAKKQVDDLTSAANAALQEKLGAGAALPEKPEEHYPEETRQQLKALKEHVTVLEAARPELSTAMGVAEGEITDLPIHVRGSHLSLGETVPRDIPAVLAGTEGLTIAASSSGRRELADWLVSPDNPLTGRVLANRAWRWHFGRGLVATPDNFGELGEHPSHPQLLDWLAVELMSHGSLKDLHRLIVLSSTYRMSSRHDERAAAVDPENRLLWRAPLQRLEAEALRDSLLAVSGLLDYSMGGSMLHVKNREFFFDHTSKDTTSYDSRRRSVYLPVVRNHLYDVFQLFDYNEANVTAGHRNASTIPTQALFLLNGELMDQAAEALARQVTANAGDGPQRIEQLYWRVFARPPNDTEREQGLRFVQRLSQELTGGPEADLPELRSWQCLCQVLLASNEFLYLR